MITGCSNDSDKKDDPSIPIAQECGMKVRGMSAGGELVTYSLTYGTSNEDQILVTVSKEIRDFYQARMGKGNYRWIGEVTHE